MISFSPTLYTALMTSSKRIFIEFTINLVLRSKICFLSLGGIRIELLMCGGHIADSSFEFV